ncbi:hypothetical protein [Aquisphaera insulae]|uniref:hypothetical protein n=1 Tax=Aquisphaera insulae TaxID=2712864 RepID=UPI0013E9EC34|nr:hypothetical protein [Aquisphaera insulae]
MSSKVRRVAWRCAGIALYLGLVGSALAGPAKYTGETRSARVTYTFAEIPSFGMTPDQLQTLGRPQSPSKEQEAYIRALVKDASTVLYELSEKRLRIDPFDYVENVKGADIVISLTGDPGRGGWATPGGIEGRPGQIGLYFKNLQRYSQEQAALTVAHEISHYIFALPDEYQDGATRGLCPQANAMGPGCLMDNYFLRQGDYGRFCNGDHNAQAPNPITLAHEHTQQQSCKFWVDKFFQLRPPSSLESSDEVKLDTAAVSADQPFTGRFRSIVNATTTFARGQIADKNIGKNRTSIAPKSNDLTQIKRLARVFLDTQLKVLGSDPDFIKPTSSQKTKALELIARNAFSDPAGTLIEATSTLGPEIIDNLRVKARELASAETAKITRQGGGGLAQSLLSADSSAPERLKRFQPTIDLIKKALLAYLTGAGGGGFKIASAPGPNTLGPEEQRLVEKIAREAVLGTSDSSSSATLTEAAKLHIRLSLETAQNLIDVSSDLDVPGVESRTQDLRVYRDLLSKFALPGKTFTGFGRRRTYIVAPPSLYPEKDLVRIDAGDKMPYEQIRRLAINQITKLIDRERIEEVEVPLTGDLGAMNNGDRLRAFNKMVNSLTESVRRNRAENIILITPPGGLPVELSDELEGLRARLQKNGDVRLDVIEMFDGSIPLRLRDQAHQSGGTVQLVADIDELGTIAQRIKNDISAGAWVSFPDQGTINLDLGTTSRLAPKSTARETDSNFWQEIVTNYVGDRRKPKGGLLSEIEEDLDNNLRRNLDFINSAFLKNTMKPPEYESLSVVQSSLYKLTNNLRSARNAIRELQLGNVDGPADRAIGAVRQAKDTIHALVWRNLGRDEGFLARTDDALDGQLRDAMRRQAIALESQAKENEDCVERLETLRQGVVNTSGEKDKDALIREFSERWRTNARRLHLRAASLHLALAEYDSDVRLLERQLSAKLDTARDAANTLKKLTRWQETFNRLKTSLNDLKAKSAGGTAVDENSRKKLAALGSAIVSIDQSLRGKPIFDRIPSLEEEIQALRKEIDKLRSDTDNYLAERTPDTKVSPEDLVAAAENETRFIKLILDQHAQSKEETFTPHWYYEEELRQAVSLLERAADHKPEPRRFARVLGELITVVDRITSLTPNVRAADPEDPTKTKLEEEKATDVFHLNELHISKRLDDLRVRSNGLSRDSGNAEHWATKPAAKSTALLNSPLNFLVDLLTPDVNVLDSPKDTSAYDVLEIASNARMFADARRAYRSAMAVGVTPEFKSVAQAPELAQLYKQIADTKSFESWVVSAPGARPRAFYVDIADGYQSPIWEGLSPTAMNSPRKGQLFKELEDRNQFDLVRDWTSQVVNETYFLKLHSIHEALRTLEERLTRLAGRGSQPRAVFERIKEARKSAPVKRLANDPTRIEVEFRAFQAEEGASYEFVLGLSRPLTNFEKLRGNPEEHPEIRLFANGNLVERPYLRLEPDFSSDTMLVFRAPKPDLRAGLLGQGLYTPKLVIKDEYLPLVGGDGRIGYTFSIGTRRPNVQIIASLRQPQPKIADKDPAKDPENAFRGVIAADQFDAVVEAEVFAGAPVLEANVKSTLQRVDTTNVAIQNPVFEMRDDGIYPDLLKDDGIYTTRITLLPAAQRKPAEYRVFVEAKSNDKVRFYPLADPIIDAGADNKPEKKTPPPVPPFQRATSVNFHAAQES